MIDKKVSICVLFYNQEKFVERTLNSLLKQDYKEYEIIIRDDCSNDSTQQVIKNFLDNNEFYNNNIDIKVDYGNKNLGIIKSLNKTLAMCTGEIIVLCGGDDISMKDRLSKSVKFITKYDVDMVACDAKVIDENDNILLESFYLRNKYEIDRIRNDKFFRFKEIDKNIFLNKRINNKYIGTYCLGGFGITFNRRILSYYNGYFPENIDYEDRFITFLSSINKGFIWILQPLVYYRRTQINVSMPKAENIKQIKKQMIKLISMETKVCKEQCNYLNKVRLLNDNYDKDTIIQCLEFEENRNKLIIRSLGEVSNIKEKRLKLLKKLIKNNQSNKKKKIKSFILFLFPITATYLIKKQYIKRKEFFMN